MLDILFRVLFLVYSHFIYAEGHSLMTLIHSLWQCRAFPSVILFVPAAQTLLCR